MRSAFQLEVTCRILRMIWVIFANICNSSHPLLAVSSTWGLAVGLVGASAELRRDVINAMQTGCYCDARAVAGHGGRNMYRETFQT